jgi:hypothetical protein
MPTRITEQKLPFFYNAGDLGQAEGDAQAVVISYHTSPVVVNRKQTYVVFVLDGGLQGTVASYRWTVEGNTINTQHGVLEYSPTAEGTMSVSVDLLNSGSAVLKTIALSQQVIALNAELETLISAADETSPTAANPDTSRELVNDVRWYIDDIAPRTADSVSSLNKLLFACTYAEAMLVAPEDRAAGIERLAGMLADNAAEGFAEQAASGMGICQLRPHAVAMYFSETDGGTNWLVTRRELPNDKSTWDSMLAQMKTAIVGMDAQKRVDLFNVLRFPKTNIKVAMQFLEALRTQYFTGQDLPSILADEAKARNLITEYKEGPFALS